MAEGWRRLDAYRAIRHRDAIRVIVPPARGSVGGKCGEEAVDAARLARTIFRPVMVHRSRADEFPLAQPMPHN